MSASGNAFWNQGSVVEYIDALANFRRAEFSGWPISTIRALSEHAINGGQGGFLGALFSTRNIAAGVFVGQSLTSAIAADPSIFNAYATSATFVLNQLTELNIDVTSGLSLPWASLDADAFSGLLQNGRAVLEDANATQFAAIPANILASLTPIQANLLPARFWQGITAPQLTAMFNSPTLGVAFFSNAGTAGHISVANYQAMNPAVLGQLAQVQVNQEQIHQMFVGNWTNSTLAQQGAVITGLVADGCTALIPVQPNEELGFAGNSASINQQIIAAQPASGPTNGFTDIGNVIAANYKGEVASGATWAKGSTVTVSAAGLNAAQMAMLQSDLDQYAAITGLTFQLVASNGQIDIGFANLDTANTGKLGATKTYSSNSQLLLAQITLENPNETPLTSDGSYTGTSASFNAVLLHELGHALGMSDNNVASSIGNYYLSSSNQELSDADKIAFKGLYGVEGGSSANLITEAGLTSLLQAMASAHTPVGSVTTATGVFTSMPGTQTPLTLVSTTVH